MLLFLVLYFLGRHSEILLDSRPEIQMQMLEIVEFLLGFVQQFRLIQNTFRFVEKLEVQFHEHTIHSPVELIKFLAYNGLHSINQSRTFSTRSIKSRFLERFSKRFINRSVIISHTLKSSSHFGWTTSLGHAPRTDINC